MMKILLSLSVMLMLFFSAYCQEPVQWQFTATQEADGKYQIHLKASVQAPWHTYSQSTPEGGPFPTKITFSQNPLLTLQGAVEEVGKIKTIHDKTFDVDVKYFPGNVDFVQHVQLKGKVKTKITGSIKFMVCNDQQCLPPKSVPFSIDLQ